MIFPYTAKEVCFCLQVFGKLLFFCRIYRNVVYKLHLARDTDYMMHSIKYIFIISNDAFF